jgi:SAM-dependent methyltransferase
MRVRGCDLSARAIDFARRKAVRNGAGEGLDYFVHDALNDPLPGDCDVLVSSLFLHHLSLEQAQGLLKRMKGNAQRLVLINDLLRSRAGLLLAHAATRILSSSSVVHSDGPQSVRAAFTLNEVRAMADQAGLTGCKVEKRWPCRFLLKWRRPDPT